MSTRAVITVRDEYDSFSVYRHCDGYPEGKHGVIFALSEVLSFAWELPRFEAADFAAAIIRAWKREDGGDIYMSKGADYHGDLDYVYEVTFDGELRVKVSSPDGEVYADGPYSEVFEKYAYK